MLSTRETHLWNLKSSYRRDNFFHVLRRSQIIEVWIILCTKVKFTRIIFSSNIGILNHWLSNKLVLDFSYFSELHTMLQNQNIHTRGKLLFICPEDGNDNGITLLDFTSFAWFKNVFSYYHYDVSHVFDTTGNYCQKICDQEYTEKWV